VESVERPSASSSCNAAEEHLCLHQSLIPNTGEAIEGFLLPAELSGAKFADYASISAI
jgi:hypothetical protein